MVQLDRDIRRLSEQLAAQQALLEDLRGQLDLEIGMSARTVQQRNAGASNGSAASVGVRQGA